MGLKSTISLILSFVKKECHAETFKSHIKSVLQLKKSTSDIKVFKMSHCLLILSIEGTKTRVNIRMIVNAVVFKLETGFRC